MASLWDNQAVTIHVNGEPVSDLNPLPSSAELGDITLENLDIAKLGGVAIDLGAGSVGGGTQRTTLGSDDPAVAALATLIGHVDGVEALLTTIDGRVDGLETLLTTIDGRVDGLEALAAVAPAVGTSPNKWVADGTDYRNVPAAAAAKLWRISVFNFTTALVYIHIFNLAADPTVASDTPVDFIAVPPASAAGQLGAIIHGYEGMTFSTGIAYSVVAELAKTGTTPIAANGVVVCTEYKLA